MVQMVAILCLTRTVMFVLLSHTPHCFEGVGLMFMDRLWAIHAW